MRTKSMLCAMAAFAMSSPAMAAIGEIQLDLTHNGGSNTDVVLLTGVGGVIPVEVSFTATTSGSTGANRGVAGVNVSLDTSLPLVHQQPMTLDPGLVGARNAATTTTLGFTSFNDNGVPKDGSGDPFKETIDSVSAFQGVLATFDFVNTKGKFKIGAHAESVGHSSPVLMATGNILVDPSTPAGTYTMTLIGNTQLLWDTSAGQAQATPGSGVGDTLNVVIQAVPEPATILLLAPLALAIRRRRNAA